jgi:hypothetical protein
MFENCRFCEAVVAINAEHCPSCGAVEPTTRYTKACRECSFPVLPDESVWGHPLNAKDHPIESSCPRCGADYPRRSALQLEYDKENMKGGKQVKPSPLKDKAETCLGCFIILGFLIALFVVVWSWLINN